MNNALKFRESHEWVLDNGDGTITMGISQHAQELLGDVVFVEAPEVDDEFEVGDVLTTVESTKAASDIYTPVTGVVVEVNEELEDSPELINEGPYDAGWICKIKISDEASLAGLKTAEEYLEAIED
ncbi:glycine cleavage system protein GcvH [Vibrio sp.]|nr:glycine cleavage system protein GcvH [Vibrio sp.]